MIGGARIISKRLPGLNVDARRSSDPCGTATTATTTTSHSSGRSFSRRNAIVMLGGPRILSKRLSGLNVNARRSSDFGVAATKSHSSGQSSSMRTMLSGGEDDEHHHQEVQLSHGQEVIGLLAANRASAKRDSFRGSLPPSLLRSYDERDCVAPILLEEINFGPKLGAGEFSDVYEIDSFNLQSSDDVKDTKSAEELEKRLMLKQCEKYRQTRKARYALKHLKGKYFREHDTDKCIQAVCDLVLEAEFLASLNHPHIIKLRGMAFNGTSGFETGPNGYFLIMDRLFETLADRIQRWAKPTAAKKGKRFSKLRRRSISFGGSLSIPMGKASTQDSSDSSPLPSNTRGDELMDERLSIALQIAAGLKYLHSHNIIFRDLKPANIGFDVRGDVKLFDFGLARIMPDDGCPYTDTFFMSGAGSPRYMAPECLTFGESYNMKADIYSFAIILWEMLSAALPYAFVRRRDELIQHVVHDDERPEIDEEWPAAIKCLLESSFDKDINLRPEASLFCDIIRDELKKLRKGDNQGLNDSWIERRRSFFSFTGMELPPEQIIMLMSEAEEEESPQLMEDSS